MDNRKYKKYINEICIRNDISKLEAEALFRTAIARAYDAIGAAYLWEDGTITVAKDNRGSIVYLKNYVVSEQQYIKIIKFFEILLDKHSQKRDTLMFVNKIKGSIIEALVVKEDFDNFYLKPIVDMGALTGYKFTLPKKKLFFGEEKKVKIGSKINVVCKGFNDARKTVLLSRFEKSLAGDIFEEIFNESMSVLDDDYSYQNYRVNLNGKTRAIFVEITWGKKPTSSVISFIGKEMNEVVGRCTLIYNEVAKKEELDDA